MATFVELYGDRLDRELGSDDRTELFTTTRRQAAINEAQGEFVRLTEALTRQVAIPLTDGTAEYDLESVITAGDYLWLAKDAVELKRVDASGTTRYLSGEDLPRRDVAWLNRYEPGWRTAPTGTPRAYYLREDGGQLFLGFSPAPKIATGETAEAWVRYVALPGTMSADSDEPFTVAGDVKRLLRPWHQALVHYAASKLELLRKDREASQAQLRLFSAYVTDYLQKQRRPGGTHVTLLRDYFREAARASAVRLDPRRF